MLKTLPVLFAVMFGLTLSAHAAESLDSALKKVDKLRDTFGDQYVSALTNLSPDQYKAERERALKAADKAGDNTFSRDDARKQLCSGLGAAGPNCENAKSGDDLVNVEDDVPAAVSAVEKNSHGGEDDVAPAPAQAEQPQPTASIDENATGNSVSHVEAATADAASAEQVKADAVTDPAVAQALSSDDSSDSAELAPSEPSRQLSSVPQSESDPAL